jgi:hypothetical protein
MTGLAAAFPFGPDFDLRTVGDSFRQFELGQKSACVVERRGENPTGNVKQIEDHRVTDRVEDACAFLASLDEVGPPQHRELLREV